MRRTYPVHNGDRLEVGPGNNVLSRSCRRVEGNGNTQTTRPHGTLSTEALYRLHETPSWNGTKLDLPRFEDTVASDDTPTVVERVYD